MSSVPLAKEFPADRSALSEVRQFLLARAEEDSVPTQVADDLLVSVTEACNEILNHETSSVLLVSWRLHADAVEVLVKDLGVTGRLVPIPQSGEDDGLFDGRLGFPHILEFADEFEVKPGGDGPGGTVVRVVRETSGVA